MSNLWRRLRKLEAQLTDERGLVPHTPKWLAYWTEWVDKLMRDENPPGRISIEAFDAVVNKSRSDEHA